VSSVNESRLLAAADADTRMLQVVPMVGDFLAIGAPLAVAWGTWDRTATDEVRGAIAIGGERTLEQDPAFGFRQLVDVAVRALSPGTNDPTTAVQALDRLHDLLRRLALRQFPSPVHEVDGRVRLIVPGVTWLEYLRLATDEIRLSGESQLHVMRRLRALLEDLATIAPPERLPAVRAQLAALDAGVERGFSSERDRELALTSSRDGQSAELPIASRPERTSPT
jgi:uncharacterized membrane protein